MFELQKFELGQDEETLRRAVQIRLSNLGPIVEVDGIELDRLLELAFTLQLQTFELAQNEATLRKAQRIRLSNMGPLVEIDGVELDRLIELATEAVRQSEDELFESELFESIGEVEYLAEAEEASRPSEV